MAIQDHFASTLGDKTQTPNKQLASNILKAHDTEAVKEINSILQQVNTSAIIGDAIKVIEIIGESNPEMASLAFDGLIKQLGHKANKIQWRAMSALSTMTHLHLSQLYNVLPSLLKLMDNGSVITRDHGISILIHFYQQKAWQDEIAELLAEQVLAAPDNQLGQYAEKWMAVIDPIHVQRLIKVLEARQPELTHPSHQKRISRVLSKLLKKV